MIIGDLNLGPFLPNLAAAPLQTNTWSEPGQAAGSALVYGGHTVVWATGAQELTRTETVYVEAPTALGGSPAGSQGALRYLVRQLQELAANADLQPVYVQWRSGGGGLAVDPDDGWWILKSVRPDMNTEASGWAAVTLTCSRVAPAIPFALSMLQNGSDLSTTYTATPVNLIALPLGATGPSVSLSRVGGEGTVPLVILPSGGPNPCPLSPSATLANLFKGGVRCYDSVTAGGNAVDTTGTGANAFVHQTWVQIYGPDHNLTGDLIVTNGLWLLRVNQGGIGIPDAYLWNTLPGTPAWQQVASLQYKDSSFNVGTIRSITLDRVGLRSSRASVVASTSAAHFARVSIDLDAGHLEPIIEFSPLTQANSVAYGIDLALSTAVKIVANESVALDVATNPSTNLNPSASAGWAVAIGGTANLPLVGLLWQSPPQAQPAGGSTTDIGFGRTSGPAQGAAETFALFATAFTATPANLFAEAEGGALAAGWSSVVDAGASAGNAAKCASGTVSGRSDLFGTSWVPPAAKYDCWHRIRVTSAAGAATEMTLGLWDATSALFVPQSSTTYRANQIPTAYGLTSWVRINRRSVSDGVTNSTTTVTSATAVFTAADVGKAISGGSIPAGATISSITNVTTVVISAAATGTASGLTLVIGALITPTAGHNMQFGALTAATLGTDWFDDQAVLVPVQSATLGQGNAPGDIWTQFAGRRRLQLVRG